MKKDINKKVISIAVIIVTIAIIAGVIYIKNKPNKTQATTPTSTTVKVTPEISTLITATVGKASFGSAVNVILSDAGKKQYKNAVKYQVYYDKKPVSGKVAIGQPTTAFPVRKEKDKVQIKLLKADDKELYSVDLQLQAEKKAK